MKHIDRELRAWAYAWDTEGHPSVVVSQMTQLLGEAERLGIHVVGMSQDKSNGKTLDRQGLKDALRAIRTGYGDAVLVREVSQLSEDSHTLLRIMKVLQNHDAVLLCTAEDAYAGLQAKDITRILRQRADSFNSKLPWIEKESEI